MGAAPVCSRDVKQQWAMLGKTRPLLFHPLATDGTLPDRRIYLSGPFYQHIDNREIENVGCRHIG